MCDKLFCGRTGPRNVPASEAWPPSLSEHVCPWRLCALQAADAGFTEERLQAAHGPAAQGLRLAPWTRQPPALCWTPRPHSHNKAPLTVLQHCRPQAGRGAGEPEVHLLLEGKPREMGAWGAQRGNFYGDTCSHVELAKSTARVRFPSIS